MRKQKDKAGALKKFTLGYRRCKERTQCNLTGRQINICS